MNPTKTVIKVGIIAGAMVMVAGVAGSIAQTGDFEPLCQLMQRCQVGPESASGTHLRLETTPGKASALTALQYAAEQGQPDAQYELGQLYLTGAAGNPHQAARWLQLAASKGHCRAEVALGDMLFQGQVVPRQAARGLMWLTLGRDCVGADETWVKPVYDSAFKRASDDERALALVYLEDWLKGRRGTPNAMAAPTTSAPRPVSTQPPPVSAQHPPAQPHHLSSCGDDLANSDLAALNTALQAAIAERIHSQELWEQSANSKEIGLPVLEGGAIKALRTQRAALMADYQNKLSTFNPDYPDMLRLKAQINQIDQEIKSALLKKKIDEVKRGASTGNTHMEHNVAVVNRAQVPDGPYKPSLTDLVKWLGFGLLAAGLGIALFELVAKSRKEIVQNLGMSHILTLCAVALAIGFIITFTTTPIYRATVAIQIDRQAPTVAKTDAASGFQNDTYRFNEYELLKSLMLAERVASDLNLASAADFLDPPSTSPWRKMRTLILPSGKSGNTATEDKREVGDLQQRKAAVAGMVQAGLSIDPVRDSNLVRISFDSPSPVWAQRIADEVADTYVRLHLERRYRAYRQCAF
jgi:uncharacterized protein involved in exopolysaccharide biosynthesis